MRRIGESVSGVRPIVCFSHLRWRFVFQRPQHLLSRFAKDSPVIFVEEPLIVSDEHPALLKVSEHEGVTIVTPELHRVDDPRLTALLEELFTSRRIEVSRAVFWYYTPMALPCAGRFTPAAVVYDCMDELSGFVGADPRIAFFERQLFQRADLVFTGGHSLFERKRDHHHSVYCFPSSVDYPHFSTARRALVEPEDQRQISGPRIGFFGVLDERLDLELLSGLADARPDLQIVMIGPTVKISPNDLPKRGNIHYLGMKEYQELPRYLAHWQIAILPFARNAATRFISPTKTPEYLAGGKPVISTSIRDVVRPYGESGLVEIADQVEEFAEAIDRYLNRSAAEYQEWLRRVDAALSSTSWNSTYREMRDLIADKITRKEKGSSPARVSSTGLSHGVDRVFVTKSGGRT